MSPASEVQSLPKENLSEVCNSSLWIILGLFVAKRLGPPLIVPPQISALHQNDQNALNHLCIMYNTFRARVIYAEEQHQVLVVSVKARGHDMALAIEQLEQFRVDLTECFKLALEEIGDRGSELTGNV